VRWGGRGEVGFNKQRRNFLVELALMSSDTLPSRDLRWSENGLLLLTALYLFTYCFDKKRIALPRYSRIVVQKSKIGHLDKIFRYETLKLLRSYSAFKGQERD